MEFRVLGASVPVTVEVSFSDLIRVFSLARSGPWSVILQVGHMLVAVITVALMAAGQSWDPALDLTLDGK